MANRLLFASASVRSRSSVALAQSSMRASVLRLSLWTRTTASAARLWWCARFSSPASLDSSLSTSGVM